MRENHRSKAGVVMAEEYVSKIQAISIVMAATGYGRRTIDKMFEKLVAEGRITLNRDFDGRTYRISRAEVDTLIKVLKREIE
jgi:excisionase family DNA binding protein